MTRYQETKQQDLRRRRRERLLMMGVFAVISVLTYLGTRVADLGLDLPFSGSILVFALINLNVILLLLLLYLTVRNLVKLIFERRKGILGARLRTKLVAAFVTLSLLPTVILFFVSAQFISTSMEYWFSLQIEQSLKNSSEIGREYYERIVEDLLSFGNALSRVITYEGGMLPSQTKELEKFIEDKRKEYGLTTLEVYGADLTLRARAKDRGVDLGGFKPPGADLLRGLYEKGSDGEEFQSASYGDLIRGIVPIFSRTESKAVVGLLVLSRFVPGSLVNRLKAIAMGIQEYRQLKMLKKPIKISHMITLSIVTLLIIFSSVWFGFYLSREITVPIQELAEGTQRIASGDYDFRIDLEGKDEIGLLVQSFNRMTHDLKTSKLKLEEANRELLRSNVELEQRRLYMEIVLANVAAGVVSADAGGKILTMNKSAAEMLRVRSEEVVGRNYRDLLSTRYVQVIERFLADEALFQKGSLKRQVRLSVEGKPLTLLVSLDVLRDERGNYLGLVAVFEDLTEIEKAQRMAAWRDVARRIAHEVKNPLTPIQLSAQRLRKRYGETLEGRDREVFDECTSMIIAQVEELKRLVNEFSQFARMPAVNLSPGNISEIIREALALYKEAHKDVEFVFRDTDGVPVFDLDREQMKRVFINLLDNAIEAMDAKGRVEVLLTHDPLLRMVRIEVADTGKGVPPGKEGRLFEPYFSTKKHGTGLGLAIASSIVADHNGFIRVQRNRPKGTRFIIELPVRVSRSEDLTRASSEDGRGGGTAKGT